MNGLPMRGRSLALLVVVIPLLLLFVYVGLRSGPLAPVAVTVATVESREIAPSLFGIGTVEARYTYRIGPTFAGRVKRLDVHVGDRVKAGQVLGEMEPVDLDERVRSMASAFRRLEAILRDTEARHSHARTQAERYERLFAVRAVSEEILTTRRQELQIAEAAFSAAREDLARARADREGLVAQRSSLRLIAPTDGVVVGRDADPGTTIVAGQAVVEVVDHGSLWVNVRFDQISASGLSGELSARIVLRSRAGEPLKGRVLRVEPKADAVTEEILAKVVFDAIPQPLPPLGELAEVTVDLPALPSAPAIVNAAVRRVGDRIGVWKVVDGDLRFSPIKPGATDLNGMVQVREGLDIGDKVVIYSEKTLTEKSRIKIVEQIPGAAR